MDVFPFTAEEWAQVEEITTAMVNATMAEDPVLRASLFAEFRELLAGLRTRYEDHPILLETEADFTDEAPERVHLYERAKRIAQTEGHPTYSIRISLGRVLLKHLGEPRKALQELMDCRSELETWADDWERKEWVQLVQECTGIDNGQNTRR